MEWDNFRRSDYVEDRRGDDGSGGYDSGGGGGGGGGMVGAGGLGLGTIVVLGLIGWALGIDPRTLINGAEMLNGSRHGSQAGGPTSDGATVPYRESRGEGGGGRKGPPSDQLGQFVAAILGETEDTWSRVLPEQTGVRYQPVNLVLFTDRTRSACGGAKAAMGPFYCPIDKKVYLDLSFFAQMKQKLGGGGDFAYAYVIAHEIGHHVQDQLGTLGKVQAAEQRVGTAQRNALSQRIELQADCFAGVWAANANRKDNFLQPGDVEKAVRTAQAIGDDTLQERSQGYAVPDSFTHGSSAERVRWLKAGLSGGKIASCDTFSGDPDRE